MRDQTVSDFASDKNEPFCHFGLDPESSSFSERYSSGCRIKSGMTVRNQMRF